MRFVGVGLAGFRVTATTERYDIVAMDGKRVNVPLVLGCSPLVPFNEDDSYVREEGRQWVKLFAKFYLLD